VLRPVSDLLLQFPLPATGEYTAPLMTGFPLSVAFPFVPTLPWLLEPELKLSTVALPLMLKLLQPFAVANSAYVESDPTLLMELTPAPVREADCVVVPPARPLSSFTFRSAVATPLLLGGGANFTLIVQLLPVRSCCPGAGQVFVWVK
jgi:hypothetical protein